jgi:predicted acylesterase/phospholipase RssA
VVSRTAASPRALVVVADGLHAGFAAGAVAALAERGARWTAACGAGLGAHVAALAVLGEAGEVERRWRRMSESGMPLFESRLAAARSVPLPSGVLVLPDALALGGWLAEEPLVEHLEPERAGVPERLRREGVTLWAAVEDLVDGRREWADLAGECAAEAGDDLEAAARFPAGWPPWRGSGPVHERVRWGGTGALPGSLPDAVLAMRVDLVCGFPVPAARRPELGDSLLELVQRREEIGAAGRVENWVPSLCRGSRLVAPRAEQWAEWSGRDCADLGVEYPLPWSRNGEVAGAVVRFGREAARRALAGRRG